MQNVMGTLFLPLLKADMLYIAITRGLVHVSYMTYGFVHVMCQYKSYMTL